MHPLKEIDGRLQFDPLADPVSKLVEISHYRYTSLDSFALFYLTRWVDTTFVPNGSIKLQHSS